jgi:hypothetical protein
MMMMAVMTMPEAMMVVTMLDLLDQRPVPPPLRSFGFVTLTARFFGASGLSIRASCLTMADRDAFALLF